MRIITGDPYGLTGSERIDGFAVYISKEKFTPDDLPTPYIKATSSYSSYNLTLPEYNTPYWVMWSYHSGYDQTAYSPLACLMEFPPNLIKVYNNSLLITSGDAIYGVLSYYLAASDRIYPDTFSINAGLDYRWDAGNQMIQWYLINSKRVGVSNTANKSNGTARDMYKNGYLGRSGTMESELSTVMMDTLGAPVTQGRMLTTTMMNWFAWVPTLAEFKEVIGAVYQSGIETDAPPLTGITLLETKWYLTSTESTTVPGKFVTINSKGETSTAGPDDSVVIQLLFEGNLLPAYR